MGKRGPKPTPTVTLKLRGSTHLARRDGEPQPPTGTPTAPSWLTDREQEAWTELIGLLSKTPGLLVECDGPIAALWCEAWVDLQDARQEIAEHGATCYSEKGGAYQHPAVGRKNAAIERIKKLSAEFGMSPASRASVKVSPVQKEDNGKKKFFA